MASNELVKKIEKNTQAIAKINGEIEKAVGAQIQKRNELEAANANMREAIKTAMEETGTTKFDGDLITITYKKPSQRTIFDSTRFKEEKPKTYAKYLKTSEVKSSISIKLKA